MVVESQQYDSLKPQCAVCVDDGIDDPVDEDDIQHQLQDEGTQERNGVDFPRYLGDREVRVSNEMLRSLDWNVLCTSMSTHSTKSV